MNEESARSKFQGESTINRENGQDRRFYLSREPVILTVLSVLATVFFLAVTGLSHVFHAQQESLGTRWFTRGAEDLRQQRFTAAEYDLRTALLYSRDNFSYQFNLAEALIGQGRRTEARAYLVNLWDRAPENGQVNLELARIAVQSNETEKALRYYHNAIYAAWPGDQELERRDARLELVEFLLGIHATKQAQSELIALAANLDNDPSQHARVADLFFRAQDYEHAFAEYLLSLKSGPQNPAVLAGAGRAAFELRRYPLAQRYLQAAVAANPSDASSFAILKTTELVLRMDPFSRSIPLFQRDRIVVEDFATAGARLKSCPGTVGASSPVSSAATQPNLAEQWMKMSKQVTERGLRRNPELIEGAMDLVFEIEHKTNDICGAPTGNNLALLLISKSHEGN
jgi:tetratricopeptide (TPR) repeat protein